MESIIRQAVEVGDEDYGVDNVSVYRSTMFKEFRWKYRKAHFFAFTQRSKEAVMLGAVVIGSLLLISYFTAHFLLYITGYYVR